MCSQVSVNLFTGVVLSLVPCPFQGWVSLVPGPFLGVGMSTHPLDMGPQGRYVWGWVHGIQRDMVGKRAVCILLECFLVNDNFYLVLVIQAQKLVS